MTGSSALHSFRPDIEGLRAVAILLVVAYHAGIPGFKGGYVGVDVFFVLSGYLITGLLVKEFEKTGTISLKGFYARRIRRLLPALALMLLLTMPLAATVFAPMEQRNLALTAVSTSVYSSNVYFVKTSAVYNLPDSRENPYLHTWTLSVEEQFYLAWPLFILLCRPQNKRRLLGLLICVVAASFALSLLLMRLRPHWAFYLSPPRAWEFAVGAIAVLLPPRFLSSSVTGWVGLAGILLAGSAYGEKTPFPGTAALLPTLSTALLLRAGNTRLARVLSVRPLQEVGRLSYSWYLWHWPLLVLFKVLYGPVSLAAKLLVVVLSLLCAELSYRLVENPIRRDRRLTRGRSLVMAGIIALAGVSLSLIWLKVAAVWAASPKQLVYTQAGYDLPVINTMGCNPSLEGVEVKKCVFGPANSTRTVVLLGDSHAEHWFPTIREVFSDWRLVVMVKSACPTVDAPFFYETLGRVYTGCSEWRARALDEISALHPDLVIATSAYGYPFSDEEWRTGTRRVLDALTRASSRVLIIRDTPKEGYDVTRCLARLAWRSWPGRECPTQWRESSEHVYAIQTEIAGEFSNLTLVDMNEDVRRRAELLRSAGGVAYRDGEHLTATFARSLAFDLRRRIESLGFSINR